jgi:hypothetical protein
LLSKQRGIVAFSRVKETRGAVGQLDFVNVMMAEVAEGQLEEVDMVFVVRCKSLLI